MNFSDVALRLTVKLLRPLTNLRGGYRICRLLNRVFLFAGCSPLQQARMRDGSVILVDIRSHTEWYALWSGLYDDTLLTLMLTLLKAFPGNFLDVGSNIGMYAIRVSRLFSHKVVCFEPMPINAERIRHNASLNGVEQYVKVISVALSDHEGSADLILREDFKMGSLTGNASIAISSEIDGGFQRITVPVIRFDDFLSHHSCYDFSIAKIDIEGHEDFFIRGAKEWFERDRPIVMIEVNNFYYVKRGTSSSKVLGEALPNNYRVALIKTNFQILTLEEISFDSLSTLNNIENCLLFPAEKWEKIRAILS
jgi:FkbM family methyltransferase